MATITITTIIPRTRTKVATQLADWARLNSATWLLKFQALLPATLVSDVQVDLGSTLSRTTVLTSDPVWVTRFGASLAAHERAARGLGFQLWFNREMQTLSTQTIVAS